MDSKVFITKNPREAAYFSLIYSHNNKMYIDAFLNKWKKQALVDDKNFRLAKEISSGTMRMMATLDFFAAKLSLNGKIKLKSKDKMLIRMALYQHIFMDKMPAYAIVCETVKLAKKHASRYSVSFINAILRQMEGKDWLSLLPNGDNSFDMSCCYSYPKYFIDKLLISYGVDITKQILQSGNTITRPSVRGRNKKEDNLELPVLYEGEFFKVYSITDTSLLRELTQDKNYYIQNITPVYLMEKLSKNMTIHPNSILDLCSSPGGKLILSHDIFPDAKLYANDIAKRKIEVMEENFRKYNMQVEVRMEEAQNYPSNGKFDLIIVDAPCSNSGVLNKRTEARWRIDKDNLEKHTKVQRDILSHAATLLSDKGKIFYMTCSILEEENEGLVKFAREKLGLTCCDIIKVVPNDKGWDGGFGCCFHL
jgi:16S rRNA (cytosine967-C5)-methyltransferase